MTDRRRPWTRLSGRLIVLYAVIAVGLIALLGAAVRVVVRDALVDQLTASLGRNAESLQESLPDAGLEEAVRAQAGILDARVTVIGVDGRVLADSDEDPAAMENHAGRREVALALAGGVGVDRRVSATLGDSRLYVAAPVRNGRVVRLSVTEVQIEERSTSVTRTIVLWSFLVGAFGILVVALAARRIARPIGDLTGLAQEVAAGRLDIEAPASDIAELDQLGSSIETMATELGRRVQDSEAERRTLEAVLGALPQGVVLVESDGSIPYGNATAQSILGAIPESIVSLAPRSLQRVHQQARETGHGADAFDLGSPARRYVASSVAFDQGRVVVVLEDVTDRFRVEAMRKDFVADASHELKTPIASILASSEALELAIERSPDRAPEFASNVVAAARQLARIVDDLLDLSRLESSELPVEEVAVDRVVREEVERLGPRAQAAGLELSLRLEPAVVSGSRSDIALAVRNLCDNALRYTETGGKVLVSVMTSADRVFIEVEDTGHGIPKRALPRVFERFYRVDVARSRATGGTGLGLAIVKHVVERHGGAVSVESELGVGSTFRIELPSLTVSLPPRPAA